jgi:hypothetical protein
MRLRLRIRLSIAFVSDFDLLGVPAEDHEAMREATQAVVMFPSSVYKGDLVATTYW